MRNFHAVIVQCAEEADIEPQVVRSTRFSPYGTHLAGITPGLTGFSLEFTNGDHHISWLGAGMRTSGSSGIGDDFVLAFSDRHHGVLGTEVGDPVRMSAWFYDMEPFARPGEEIEGYTPDPPRVKQFVSERGSGRTRISMPPLASDMLFVLCGFAFRTVRGNHNLLALEVAPNPYEGYIDVDYRDNDGNDEYRVEVSYTAVPRTPRHLRHHLPLYFDGPFDETFNFRGEGSTSRLNGYAFLQGFRLSFANGDHHLLKCAVELGTFEEPRIDATLRDNDDGNPVDAYVQYIVALGAPP